MQRILRIGAVLLVIGWCVFIWHFSLADGVASAATSKEVLENLNNLFDRMGLGNPFTHQTVRKIGHFLEFFALGFLIAAVLWLLGFRSIFISSGLAVLLVACVDEGLQCFSPGRNPSPIDVLLDTAGGVCGALLFCALVWSICRLRERYEKNSK